jgi:hypothetical protein
MLKLSLTTMRTQSKTATAQSVKQVELGQF